MNGGDDIGEFEVDAAFERFRHGDAEPLIALFLDGRALPLEAREAMAAILRKHPPSRRGGRARERQEEIVLSFLWWHAVEKNAEVAISHVCEEFGVKRTTVTDARRNHKHVKLGPVMAEYARVLGLKWRANLQDQKALRGSPARKNFVGPEY